MKWSLPLLLPHQNVFWLHFRPGPFLPLPRLLPHFVNKGGAASAPIHQLCGADRITEMFFVGGGGVYMGKVQGWGGVGPNPAKPIHQTKSNQTKRSYIPKPSQARPNQAKPNQAHFPSMAKQSQAIPTNQTKPSLPSQAKPSHRPKPPAPLNRTLDAHFYSWGLRLGRARSIIGGPLLVEL
jgi:hypothetical protein